MISVSDNMVMEVVSAAVSGRDMAGNWIRIVYTESEASPLQSVKIMQIKVALIIRFTHFLSRPGDYPCSGSDDSGIRYSISGLLTCCCPRTGR